MTIRHPGTYKPHPYQPVKVHHKVQASLGLQDRIALVITGAVGTMYAVYVFAMFMAAWMLFQVVSGKAAFDPFPFAFLLFMGNIVQLLLMPLIMVGQNLQGRHTEARAEEEYKTVGKTFSDLETVMRHLDAQDRELIRQSDLLLAMIETLVPASQRKPILDRFAAETNELNGAPEAAAGK